MDFIPTEIPLMIVVAAPVSDCSAISFTRFIVAGSINFCNDTNNQSYDQSCDYRDRCIVITKQYLLKITATTNTIALDT